MARATIGKAAWTIAIAVVIVTGALLALKWTLGPAPSSGRLDTDLQRVVARTVEGDPAIRNCVLAVRRGDGSFEWAGAAGIARRRGQRPMTADTPIFIASVTKLFTAAVVMRLVERGALSLDEPAAKRLPIALLKGIEVYDGKDYSGEVTIRQLLSHRSGIPDYYDEKGRDGKSLFDLLKEQPDAPWSVDAAIARARDELKPTFRPGAATLYSDTNYQLLGKLIEAVTGKPLHVAFEAEVFEPLGLADTWMIGHPRGSLAAAEPAEVFDGDADITQARFNPVYWADGGIVSTARDMVAFLQALGDGRIIRRQTLELMHEWNDWRFPLRYGLGTMFFSLPRMTTAVTGMTPLWGHSGSTGSFLYYAPQLNLYMAGTIDQTQGEAKPFLLMLRIVQAARADEARRPRLR
jgi:D-alanyl-D-alanine carboxypeptidase